VHSQVKQKLKYKGDIFFVEHHMAHAASSFLTSPFKRAAVLTLDGVGEWATTTICQANHDIKIIKELHFPHSLGLLYSAVTAYLGFKVNNDEYKVMGFAPYGQPVYYDKFRKIVDMKNDGSFRLDMSYFAFHYKLRMPNRKFIKAFGPARRRGQKMSKRHADIAASLQKLTEEVILNLAREAHRITRSKNLCIAGGVALNSVVNGKILSKTPFKHLYALPAAGDGGGCVGAACYAYNIILGRKKRFVMDDAFLGKGYSREDINEFLEKNQISFYEFKSRKELLKKMARLINDNNVVGWFQGRFEYGPRALGNRSILSNPCNPFMKDILNKKVKHREQFRPFAPVITAEDVHDYFVADKPLPIPSEFMLTVYPIRAAKQKLLPAVTHVDGSGRLQVLKRETNSLYYDLIKEFEKLSGVPVLINTSFNIRGEPIVNTPLEAYRCMMGTGIDFLVMGNFLIARKANRKHMWDSESTAKD